MQPRTFRRFWLAFVVLVSSVTAKGAWEPSEIVGLPYPLLARQARVTGVVIVRLSVAPDGAVTHAKAVAGHPLLADAACKNAAQWRFAQPGKDTEGGEEAYLVYRFALEGNCAARDCRTSFVAELPNLVTVTSEIPPIRIQFNQSAPR